jgi:CubicO group peptidase (beta-lactamase class C family)
MEFGKPSGSSATCRNAFLSGFAAAGVPSGNQITLRQLAAMRSGLYDYGDDTNPKLPEKPFRQWTPRELLETAFRHPLLFPPGSAFDYSNTNTVLLGVVVENGLRPVARVLH